MQKIIGIYIIINKFNGKRYIGASNNINRRFMEHKTPKSLERKWPLYQSFKKYGLKNFDFVIIEELDCKSKLPEKEIYWIDKLNPEYNCNQGGLGNLGRTVSDEEKAKISKKSKQQWDEMTDAQKNLRIKNNLKGSKKGYHLSDETKEKLRQINLGKKQSKETILKRSVKIKKALIGNKNGNKRVGAFKEGKLILEFESVKSAAEHFKTTPSRISVVLMGKRKRTKGYHWKILKNKKNE